MSAITGIGERRTISGSASRVLLLRYGDADDLAAGGCQRGDLCGRRLDVVRLRQRHRLHDDGRAAADRDAADRDLCVRSPSPVKVAGTADDCVHDAGCPSSLRRRGSSTLRRRPPGDLWALGADLEPGTLLAAYRLGSSRCRSTARSAGSRRRSARSSRSSRFAPSRSLRRAARRYEIRVDTAFPEVVAAAPARRVQGAGSTRGSSTAYERLHELGWAHSVEAWDAEGLAGGLYGVAIGGLFAAESMFHARTDASKAAFPPSSIACARPAPQAAPARRPVAHPPPRHARSDGDHRAPSTGRRLAGASHLPSAFVGSSSIRTAARCRSTAR